MLNSKELGKTIKRLFAKNQSNPYVVGNGLLESMKIAFDKKKLEKVKPEIATLLQGLGVDEHPLINLTALTTLKNGEVWNQLQSLEDWQALELLVACSDACGFIINDINVKIRNINNLGDNADLIDSDFFVYDFADENGKINYDKWLKAIREKVVDNMYFLPSPETIKAFAGGSQELANQSAQRHK